MKRKHLTERHPIYRDYWISRDGKVFSSRQYKDKTIRRQLKHFKNRKGYWWIGVHTDAGRVTRPVYHLVLETYKRFAKPGEIARHLDGNNQNNCVKNLAWGTHRDNAKDMHKHNLKRIANGEQCMHEKKSIAIKAFIAKNGVGHRKKKLTRAPEHDVEVG